MRDHITEDSLAVWCERASRFCAFSVAALGLAVLSGWALDIATLKSVLPGLVTMKANTALGFALAGFALLAVGPGIGAPAWRQARPILAATVLLLGLLTMAEYLLGADFGIDQLLFTAPNEPIAGAPPGRMAVATTAGFAMTGLALLLVDARRWWPLAQTAALIGVMLGLLAILGYIYNVSALYGVFFYSSVALHTALGFVLVNLGVLSARPRWGLMAVVTSQTAGGLMARRLLPVALLAPLVIGWLRVQGEHLGWVSSDFGVSLVQLVYIALFTTLILRTAQVLRNSEQRRFEAEAARSRQQAQLGAMVDSAMDAIIMVDAEERITLFNTAAETVFGHPAARMLGGRLDTLMPARFQATHRDHFRSFDAAGTTSRRMGGLGAITALHANGVEFPVEASVSQLESHGETIYTVILRDITERKQAEDTLRESEKRLAQLYAAMNEGLALHEIVADSGGQAVDYRLLDVNPAFERIIGIGRDRAVGALASALYGTGTPPFLEVYARVAATGQPESFETEFTPLAKSFHISVFSPAKGQFATVFADITGRKQAEAELAAAHRQTQELIDNATAMVYACDLEERFVLVNAALAALLETTPSQMIGRRRHEFMPQADADAHEAADRKVIAAGQAVEFEERSDLPGRSITWLSTKFPLRDEQGRICAVAGIVTDITERKQAEDALRESEEKYRNLFANMAEEVHYWQLVRDDAGNIQTWRLVDANPPTLKSWGRDHVSEIQGKTTDEIFGPGATEHYRAIVEKIMTEGTSLSFEDYFPNLDKHFRFTCVPMGEYFITTGADITDIKKVELALRESREDLDRAQAVGQIGSWRLDVRSNELTWSAENYRLFDVPMGTTLTYRFFLDCVHPDDRAYVDREWQAALAGAPYDVVHRLLVRGQVKWVREKCDLEFGPNGELLGGFGTTQDITDIKQAEQALLDADRHKNEFIAMLAHELRNPLTPINLAAHILVQPGVEDADVRWAATSISDRVVHMTRLIDDLLDVSRISLGRIELKRETVAFAELVAKAAESVGPAMAAKKHRFVQRLPDAPVRLEADPVRLTQVLINLLDNAAKYTQEGGQIEFGARVLGREVEVTVRDNGMGIAADLLPHVFELFRQGERTLDRSQGGLGIGLSLVERLVTLHGGRIEAASPGPGKGAVFTLWLPIQESLPPVTVEQAEAAIEPQGMRVMVVDDDRLIAFSLSKMLTLHGYSVITAASGAEAIGRVSAFKPEAILLDIGLPDLDGYETARRLRALPGGDRYRLIAVSGYGDEASLAQGRAAGFDAHLIKPVDYPRLAAELTRAEER